MQVRIWFGMIESVRTATRQATENYTNYVGLCRIKELVAQDTRTGVENVKHVIMISIMAIISNVRAIGLKSHVEMRDEMQLGPGWFVFIPRTQWRLRRSVMWEYAFHFRRFFYNHFPQLWFNSVHARGLCDLWVVIKVRKIDSVNSLFEWQLTILLGSHCASLRPTWTFARICLLNWSQ